MHGLSTLVALFSVIAATGAHPTIRRRSGACFTPGTVALPAEVVTSVNAIQSSITCLPGRPIANTGGVPNVQSGAVNYSSIDFQQSKLDPLGFALATFPTPSNPADADLATLQDQLNVYLAMEAGVRSTGSSLVSTLKVPKFFLQFQMARVQIAQGQNLTVAASVQHQLGKVIKNAGSKATSAEIAAVSALAKTPR